MTRYLVISVAALVPVWANAQGFSGEGHDCVENTVLVLAPADNLRSFVPAEFTISGESTGYGTMVVGILTCASLDVARGTPHPATWSDVGIVIDSPDGTPDPHIYEVWLAGNSGQLHSRFAQLGYDAWQVPDTSYSVETATGEVNRQGESYSNTIAGLVEIGRLDLIATWWQRTSVGLVRAFYSLPGDQVAVGDGRVSAESGSILAGMLGNTEASSILALRSRFDFTVTVEVR